MEILGIGPLEIVFVLLIALIILGPNDMIKAGRTIGRFLRKLVTSPTWRTVQQTSRDLRYLPNKLMREAGLEDLKDQLPDAGQIRKDLNFDDMKDDMKKEKDRMDKEISSGLSDWTTPPLTINTPEKPPAADSQIIEPPPPAPPLETKEESGKTEQN
jgi:Sec-independent protein translocase protein TatA